MIAQANGTAPGLICPLGHKVVYAVPGVPYEMEEMFERAIAPDLQRRMGESGEQIGVIASRVVRTWGMSESSLAEALAEHISGLDETPGATTSGDLRPGHSRLPGERYRGHQGPDHRARRRTKDRQLAHSTTRRKRSVPSSSAAAGDVVFGVDDEAIEDAVARVLLEHGLTVGLAESLTGGLAASRLVNVPGASGWFRGAVVSYATDVKQSVLGVPVGPVVSEEAARAMAEGAVKVLGSDVGLAITGVAGPDPQEGHSPGTVFVGLATPGRETESFGFRVPGDRDRVRQYATIAALDLLRRNLGG